MPPTFNTTAPTAGGIVVVTVAFGSATAVNGAIVVSGVTVFFGAAPASGLIKFTMPSVSVAGDPWAITMSDANSLNYSASSGAVA